MDPPVQTTKWCPDCKLEKSVDSFSIDRSRKGGRFYKCKACRGKTTRAWYWRRVASSASSTPQPQAATPSRSVDEFEITWVEPESDPLQSAYNEHAERKDRSETRRQRDALLEENGKLKDRISELVQMQRAPEIIVYRQSEAERADAVACAIASDWHVEEPVSKDAVHGLNEFNLDIARARSESFFKNLLRLTDITARDSRITTIYIAALGDFFSGWIHDELKSSTLLAPGAAARFWRGLFASGIDFLLRESSYIIDGVMIPGNHGRMTDKMSFADPTGTSLETFAYHSLAGRYEGNPRFRMRVSDHAMVYRTFFERFTIRQIHGYETKYGGGVGGVTIPLNKAIAQWDKGVKADLTLLGHYHQLFDGGNFLLNGSLIGYNTYAQAIKASPEEARQAFFLVHARNGGVKSITAPIWLDK